MVACEICGRPDADCRCVKCGRVICERCFNGIDEMCIDCSPRPSFNGPSVIRSSSSGISSSGLRMAGMLLIAFGLLVTSLALMPQGAEGEGFVFIFPFFLGNVSGTMATRLTILFFVIFIATWILPWYMLSRRRVYVSNVENVVWEPRPHESESMEYIITIDLPEQLKRTIYIDDDERTIHLRSSLDESFRRSYSLPSGFEVEDYNYEYDGSYLLLKLKLRKTVY